MKILMLILLLTSGCTTIDIVTNGDSNSISVNQERASIIDPVKEPAPK